MGNALVAYEAALEELEGELVAERAKALDAIARAAKAEAALAAIQRQIEGRKRAKPIKAKPEIKLHNMRNGMSRWTATDLAKADAPKDFEHYKLRALQYVYWRYDLGEIGHKTNDADETRHVNFECATVGGKERIKSVHIDGTDYAIPHWDFVPKVIYEHSLL